MGSVGSVRFRPFGSVGSGRSVRFGRFGPKPTLLFWPFWQFWIDYLLILGGSWVDFWWILGAKLRAKLTEKSIIWPLVGKLAESSKNASKKYFLNTFGSLGLPTSNQN